MITTKTKEHITNELYKLLNNLKGNEKSPIFSFEKELKMYN